MILHVALLPFTCHPVHAPSTCQVREKFDTPSGQPWSDPDGLLALSSEQKVKHIIGIRLPRSLPPPPYPALDRTATLCPFRALCLPSGQDIYIRRVYIYTPIYIYIGSPRRVGPTGRVDEEFAKDDISRLAHEHYTDGIQPLELR